MSAATAGVRCPLCAATPCQHLTALDVAVLRKAYRDELAVDVQISGSDSIEYLLCPGCDLRFFFPPTPGGTEFYWQLQKIPWYYMEEKAEYDIAAGHIGAADAVLEIGAGKGVFSRRLRCASYTGLETSPDAIETAKRDGIELSPEDFAAHSIRRAGQYDVVCAFQVLEHVPDPRGFLQNARRCLRDGGQLIIAVPSEDSFASIAFWDILNMPPHHLTRWSDRCLRKAADLLDLRVVALEHEPLDERHVRLYARLIAEYGIARRRGHEPQLLDPFMRRWTVRRGAKIAASILRHALRKKEVRPAGHCVVAVLQRT